MDCSTWLGRAAATKRARNGVSPGTSTRRRVSGPSGSSIQPGTEARMPGRAIGEMAESMMTPALPVEAGRASGSRSKTVTS